jgi:hypothetical protein
VLHPVTDSDTDKVTFSETVGNHPLGQAVRPGFELSVRHRFDGIADCDLSGKSRGVNS